MIEAANVIPILKKLHVLSLSRKIVRSFWAKRSLPVEEAELRKNRIWLAGNDSYLQKLATAHDGNVFTKWYHYFEIYEGLLGELSEQSRQGQLEHPLKILEIGVWRGGSLQLWREYFGESAIIFGVDIDPDCLNLGISGAEIRIGSQDDKNFLQSVVEEMGGVDIVIDDGSHVSDHVITSFNILFPLLSKEGLYIIEDLHTSYWPDWGGGLGRRSSSIEALKSLVDVLHQPYFGKNAGHHKLDAPQKTLGSIQFFDSLAVVRKSEARPPIFFLGGKRNPLN